MTGRLHAAGAVGLALLALAAWILVESRQLPFGSTARPGPAFLPVLIGVALVLVGLALVAVQRRSAPLGALDWPEKAHAACIFLAAVFAALVIDRLGFRLTTLAILLFLLGVLERQHPLAVVALALLGSWGSFWLFNHALGVPLPRGPWGL